MCKEFQAISFFYADASATDAQGVVNKATAEPGDPDNAKAVTGGVDYWWLKPHKEDPDRLNPEYLTYHDSGPCRNDSNGMAGRAFRQIKDNFINGGGGGGCVFGIDAEGVPGGRSPRAYFTARGTKCYIVSVWHESMSPMGSWNTWVAGKIVYQRGGPSDDEHHQKNTGGGFYVRPFRIDNSDFKVALNEAEEEGPFGPGPLPTDMIKEPHGLDPQWSS